MLLALLPVGVGVPLNLGDPLTAVGVVDSVGTMGRALTPSAAAPRPRLLLLSLDPPRGSSSTCPTGMVGCANRNGDPLLKAAGVGLNWAGCSALAAALAALADTGLEKDCENAFVCCAPCGDWIANPVSTELVSCCGGNLCDDCLNTVTPLLTAD